MEKVVYKARKEHTVKTCVDCPKTIGGWSGQGYCCRLDKKERPIDEHIGNQTIPDWCPLPPHEEG